MWSAAGDERGFLARTFCEREFAEHGAPMRIVQSSTIHSPQRQTLRGLHYQQAPHAEVKLVRCTRGSIFLVMVDLRPDSRTRNDWLGAELSARSERLAYIPEGFAQGYQTLEDDTEVLYQMSHRYVPDATPGGCAGTTPGAGPIATAPAPRRSALDLGARPGLARPPLISDGLTSSAEQARLLEPLRGAPDDRIGKPGGRAMSSRSSAVALVQHPEQGALVVRAWRRPRRPSGRGRAARAAARRRGSG